MSRRLSTRPQRSCTARWSRWLGWSRISSTSAVWARQAVDPTRADRFRLSHPSRRRSQCAALGQRRPDPHRGGAGPTDLHRSRCGAPGAGDRQHPEQRLEVHTARWFSGAGRRTRRQRGRRSDPRHGHRDRRSRFPRVFEMFVQTAGSLDGKSGLGIGLALARSLVERHDGRLTIRERRTRARHRSHRSTASAQRPARQPSRGRARPGQRPKSSQNRSASWSSTTIATQRT